MSGNKTLICLSEVAPWRHGDFKSMDRDKAVELFMGVAQVPTEWKRVYFMGDEDFQVAMHCVNAAIDAAKDFHKPKIVDNNRVTVSFCTFEKG